MVYKGQQLEYEKKIKCEQIVGIVLFNLNSNKKQKIINRQSIALITNSEIITLDNYEPHYKL